MAKFDSNTHSDDKSILSRKLYFINENVEYALTLYKWTGCTDVTLRDSIMANASELIKQIIRKQGLNQIYPGQEESSFGDLINTAWMQIERVLYKYRAIPHCRKCFNPDMPAKSAIYKLSPLDYDIVTFEELLDKKPFKHYGILPKQCKQCKTKFSEDNKVEPKQGTFGGSETVLFRGTSKVFNLWSQVARTVILAYIKKEGRDKKNFSIYRDHLYGRNRPESYILQRFMTEVRELYKHNDDYLAIIDGLQKLILVDDKPHDGIITKLVEYSGVSRPIVSTFLKMLKLRSAEITDSPFNRYSETPKILDRKKFGDQDSDHA